MEKATRVHRAALVLRSGKREGRSYWTGIPYEFGRPRKSWQHNARTHYWRRSSARTRWRVCMYGPSTKKCHE